MITASVAAKGQLFPQYLILDRASYQHNFVSAQDIHEKQSHRWNKYTDYAGQKSPQGQLGG